MVYYCVVSVYCGGANIQTNGLVQTIIYVNRIPAYRIPYYLNMMNEVEQTQSKSRGSTTAVSMVHEHFVSHKAHSWAHTRAITCPFQNTFSILQAHKAFEHTMIKLRVTLYLCAGAPEEFDINLDYGTRFHALKQSVVPHHTAWRITAFTSIEDLWRHTWTA